MPKLLDELAAAVDTTHITNQSKQFQRSAAYLLINYGPFFPLVDKTSPFIEDLKIAKEARIGVGQLIYIQPTEINGLLRAIQTHLSHCRLNNVKPDYKGVYDDYIKGHPYEFKSTGRCCG